MRGELDWIVMKCLEKDRNRRYETANGFAQDVQRYLADEPVQACPPSAGYRLRKFVRRNKGPVLAAIAWCCWRWWPASSGRRSDWCGPSSAAEGERRAKDTAEKRLAQIEKGIDVLGSIFEDLDPRAEEKEGRPLRAILGDRLDQAAAELEGEAVGDPLVVARLQDRLGRTYLGLGHAAKAEALFTKAVATRQAELGADHPLTLGSHAQPGPGVPGRREADRGHRPVRAGAGRPGEGPGGRPPGHPHHPERPGRGVPAGREADRGHRPAGAGAGRTGEAARGRPSRHPRHPPATWPERTWPPRGRPRPSPWPSRCGTPG